MGIEELSMSGKKDEKLSKVGALKKRRVEMADGRRYLIYYTFDSEDSAPSDNAANSSENAARNSETEEEVNV